MEPKTFYRRVLHIKNLEFFEAINSLVGLVDPKRVRPATYESTIQDYTHSMHFRGH